MNRIQFPVGARALAIALLILAACNSKSGSKQEAAPTRTKGKDAAAVTPAKEAPPAAGKEVTVAARQAAAKIFDTRCSACHGPAGRGDGAAAVALDPKPQDYHDMAWQKSVSNEEIAKAIVYGGAAVGKSPIMVPNPDLESKPDVVQALVEKVRSFGGE